MSTTNSLHYQLCTEGAKWLRRRKHDWKKCEAKPCHVKGDGEWKRNKWAIEVDSLEALVKLTETEGQIVVSAPCDYTDNYPEIEIYDTYRE